MAKRPLQIPDRSEITDDTPLRLAVAAALAYPDGSMTTSGLRKERDAGRLVTELTAGKEFTTLADIGRMRELCRRKVDPQHPQQARVNAECIVLRSAEAKVPTPVGQAALGSGS